MCENGPLAPGGRRTPVNWTLGLAGGLTLTDNIEDWLPCNISLRTSSFTEGYSLLTQR